jgi:phosphate starvation-inducible PhoH-like protein
MRGRTFLNSIIIVDEIQNLINGQLEMLVQRLGKDSKMILCGDIAQIDLKNEKTSSIHYINGMDDIKGICIIELKSNHRHPILDEVLDFFKKQKNKLSSN